MPEDTERDALGGGELPPAMVYGRDITLGEVAWSTLSPCINDIIEAALHRSSVNQEDEAWIAVLVTGASRPVAPGAGLRIEGKLLGCEAELKAEEVGELIRNGCLHLCGGDPCQEPLAGNVLHVTQVRLWSLGRFQASYLSREEKAMLTKARKREERPPPSAKDPKPPPKGTKPPKRAPSRKPKEDPQGPGRRKERRKASPRGAIMISSDEEEDLDQLLEEPDATKLSGGDHLRSILRKTRERIASQEQEMHSLLRGPRRHQELMDGWGAEVKEEDLPGGRVPRKSACVQEGLRTGAVLTPGVASPLPLGDREDLRGPGRSGERMKTAKGSKDTAALLVAQALRQSQARKRKSSSGKKGSALVRALRQAVGKSKGSSSGFRRLRNKKDPDFPDNGEDFDEGDESSSPQSDSDVSCEAPLRRRAAKAPGSVMKMLVKHVQEQMDQGALAEASSKGGDLVTGGIKIATYFALLIRPYYPVGSPLLRELYALAQTMDLLRSGKLPEAADALAARFVSVHTALAEGNWSTASQLEMYPLEPVTSTSTSTLLEAQRHKRLILKSQGYTGGYRYWGGATGKGRGNFEKGRKGDGPFKGKSKGRGKGNKDASGAKGENPWKSNKEDPGKKE